MTRAERAAEQVARAKAKLAKQREALEAKAKDILMKQQRVVAVAENRARTAVRQTTNKWQFQVGSIADEAGLRNWNATDFTALFQAIALVGNLPQVLAAMEAALEQTSVPEIPVQEPPNNPSAIGATVSRPPTPLPYAGQDLSPTTQEWDVPGWVYVVQMEGSPLYKIGCSSDVAKRLAQMQTGCPHTLRVCKIYPCTHPESLERQIHWRLATARHAGEWFDTDLATIEEAVRDLSPHSWEQLQRLEEELARRGG